MDPTDESVPAPAPFPASLAAAAAAAANDSTSASPGINTSTSLGVPTSTSPAKDHPSDCTDNAAAAHPPSKPSTKTETDVPLSHLARVTISTPALAMSQAGTATDANGEDKKNPLATAAKLEKGHDERIKPTFALTTEPPAQQQHATDIALSVSAPSLGIPAPAATTNTSSSVLSPNASSSEEEGDLNAGEEYG